MLSRRMQIVLSIVLVLTILFMAWPALAQEVTATPAPVVTPAPGEIGAITAVQLVPWLVVVIVSLIVGFIVLVHTSIAKNAALVPPEVVNIVIAALDRTIQSLTDYAKTTDTPLDDAGVQELKRQFEALKQEYQTLLLQRNTPVPPLSGLDSTP